MMRTLETNDWMVINSIIYKVNTTDDALEMRTQFLEQMKMVMSFDSADFFLASDEGKLVDPVMFNCDESVCDLYEELDYSRGIMYSGKSLVYRETDIMSEEKRTNTEYYQKVYRPNNWHYALQMILGRDKRFLGVVTFYRNIGKEDFHYDDIFLLDIVKDHLAYRLSRNYKEARVLNEKCTVDDACSKYGLTKRESTILRMILKGDTNDMISEELTISANTLKKHILNIYRKLGINSRVQVFKMIKEYE